MKVDRPRERSSDAPTRELSEARREGLGDRVHEVRAHRIAAVHPDWRRRGIARLLLLAQLAAAKRDGLETVVAWGRDGHAGRTYGAGLGFEERAETIAFRGPLK